MATNIPVTGKFKVTCEFGRKGNWLAGFHTGIDLYCDNKNIYGTCNGIVYKTGYDKSYGNYVVVKSSEDTTFHWFCHLSKILIVEGKQVTRTTILGIMGSTGNSTGIHLHFEIRKECNCYGKVENPAIYMGIPNKVGNYDTANYQIKNENVTSNNIGPELKTLARNTNLRDKPTTKSSSAVLYLTNTTLYVIEKSVAKADGFTWDKVKIRVNGKEGYMINQNYK